MLLLTLLLPIARGAAPDAVNQERLDRTIRFLQNFQNQDGGYGGKVGYPSSPTFSAWACLALAAAGINPLDQAKPGGTDAYTYVANTANKLEDDKVTDYERVLMVVNAAGTDPHNFSGIDLVDKIVSRQQADGSISRSPGGSYSGTNDTAFAILALAPLDTPSTNAVIKKAADWLAKQQISSGGWGLSSSSSPDPDLTGAAIEALVAAGFRDTAVEAKAWTYLRSTQGPHGGIRSAASQGKENTASTAWAVQAMWATGVNPADWAVNRSSPLDFMASMQQPDGNILWTADSDLNTVWMTAQVAPAFAGQQLPIRYVARAKAPVSDTNPPAEQIPVTPDHDPSKSGRGGTIQGGRGNTIVGGGNGAGLFSKPKIQSKGHETDAPQRTLHEHTTKQKPAGGPEGRGDGGSGVSSASGATSGEISGLLIGTDALGALRALKASPGPRSADTGGSLPPYTAPLIALLLLALIAGTGLEGRARPTNPFTKATA
ncbi:MAG: terpene cyclase/mutase family protein [Solirubrobacterales bacterium]